VSVLTQSLADFQRHLVVAPLGRTATTRFLFVAESVPFPQRTARWLASVAEGGQSTACPLASFLVGFALRWIGR
jgi:hypothetical protein